MATKVNRCYTIYRNAPTMQAFVVQAMIFFTWEPSCDRLCSVSGSYCPPALLRHEICKICVKCPFDSCCATFTLPLWLCLVLPEPGRVAGHTRKYYTTGTTREQRRNEVRWRRGKNQVWRPHVRTWSLSEANVLYWRKHSWHCWDFSAPLAVTRRPENCSLLAPPPTAFVTPLLVSSPKQAPTPCSVSRNQVNTKSKRIACIPGIKLRRTDFWLNTVF